MTEKTQEQQINELQGSVLALEYLMSALLIDNPAVRDHLLQQRQTLTSVQPKDATHAAVLAALGDTLDRLLQMSPPQQNAVKKNKVGNG